MARGTHEDGHEVRSGIEHEVRIGCAGWSLSSAAQAAHGALGGAGTHLERYARVFNAVEINSSFYRPHRPATYARWRDSVPETFRFAVKVPRTVTHEARLAGDGAALQRFLDESACLEHTLGCLLVQLPPKLRFEPDTVDAFFTRLRQHTGTDVACEPRHASWFDAEAYALLARHRVGLVKADPPPAAGAPGVLADETETPPVAYWRLHGAPVIYYSAYDHALLDALALRISAAQRGGAHAWCIFDNTAQGAALPDALHLAAALQKPMAKK